MSEHSINKENIVPYTVITPPVAEYLLKRPDVDHLLHNAFKKPLTTVIAGAGYGKTQAVLSALEGMEDHAAWIQLSELDNHLPRFWERIVGAFDPYSNSLYDSLLALGYPESIATFDQFLRLLARELKQPLILVFDDFHLIKNKAILNFIELFIAARVQNVSLVLTSRKKPDISLLGMLSKGLLTRITENDLRFSREEMSDYLGMQGVELDEKVLEDLYSYTDGWILAIYLSGLVAQRGHKRDYNPALAAKIDIYDLIEREIFALASQELQVFLIKISLLDGIPSELLKELAGHDQFLIAEMMHLSTFIRYDSFSDRYRVHQLLKEFLLEKKGQLTKVDSFETHATAARWYSHNNYIYEALHHYKENGCYEEIFDLIISVPGRVSCEVADHFVELIEEAPSDAIGANPLIRVAKAGYLFNNNRIDEAKQELSRVQEEFEALPTTENNKAILGEAYLLLGLIGIVNTDYEFVELFKDADELLPNGSRLVDHNTGIAEGINACSIHDPSAGELQWYQDALFRAMPSAARAMNGCGYGLEYLNAAESSLYTGDWKAAEKYAYEAIYRSRQYQQYDIEYMANFVLVRIFTAKGSYKKVTEILDQMKVQLETLQHAECLSLYDMISGWFYTKIGKTDQVAKWIKYEEETRKILAPVVVGREYLVRSDCLMAEERYYELLALIEQTDLMYEDRGILFAVIQNKITKAIIYHYLGDFVASINNLQEAYELTYPNNLIIQYIEYGTKMRTLILAAKNNENCTIPRAWLDKIYTMASSYAKMLSQLLSEYNAAHETNRPGQVTLSKRESEVLSYLCRGMTRKEIAAHCYLSLSTINSVLKSIYHKIGAFNAADAVRIAREKNLV